ncbi:MULTISPECIES: archaetidylserine decarboxylase [Salinivibrio]|uniref:Phosphatidylserine decarboxylase proenzyme n=2 Tax=Salinivibrio TaxID=51366 RepID=A0ABY7LEE6_9GAMM|nr:MULTISPECIES: archaetidylserine decarboxylase [Salinivibrio]ODP98967.1 phosphatidylserine decarboxylase [Salinivibrio sp. DV]OOF19655.1 phosphatidylserine decarboxylase [Salinivibrio sp. IB574]QIR07074.1 phosphatidylserine decarboxylase [Salinivibrio costicola]WBA14557.1 archaetidylserine decarboxylase [Salinivibrio proteolyticus]
MRDDLKVGLQYIAPKHALTRMMGKLASLKGGWLTTAVIKWFIKQYQVDMSEAKVSDPAYYRTFNDFFVRELKPALRPIDGDAETLVYPADACVSQAGLIEQGRIIQAKGHSFDVTELVGGDHALADQFKEGHFATLYLSPRDYHRVHMPCDAVLREMVYIPGDLFSVNPLTAENVPNLFARNERVVCVFETEFGPMVQVLVGATIVGSIATTWAGTVTPPTGGSIRRWEYPTEGEQAIRFAQGDEMGLFKLGSTVINLFPAGAIRFHDDVAPGTPTQMGQPYAHRQA